MQKKFMGLFIGLLVLFDAFFIAYFVAINVRKTTVVDPSLPIKAKATSTIPTAPTPSTMPSAPTPSTSNESGPVVTDTSSANESKKDND